MAVDTADDMFAAVEEAVEAGEDLGSLSRAQVATSLARLAGRGRRVARATRALSWEAPRIALGRSQVAAPKGDWRFHDPAWTENGFYRRLGQTYLAWSDAVMSLADSEDGDWRRVERDRFILTVMTSAAAPTNFFASNPAAVKRAFETGGRSLLRGTRNWLHDVRTNGGMPSQVDASPFVLGVTTAATPGAVVHRNDRCELIQYEPTTPEVGLRPVVVVPPQINKYYFLDLGPGRSFVEHAVSRGVQVFMVSWRNPGREHAAWALADYVEDVLQAIDVARSIVGTDDANVLAFCAGGITAATALAHLSAVGDTRVNSASFAVTLLDFSVPAPIGMFGERGLLDVATWNSKRAGLLEGRSLARIFSWLRPNDLVWNYWVNNVLLGEKPPAFDILAWNQDATNLPAGLHADFLEIFGKNLLCTPGKVDVLGTPVDLGRITVDTYVTGATTDHLTPWKACYRTTQLVGGDSTFVLSNAGHIQALVNPPGNPKAFFFAGGKTAADPDRWLAGAERHPGTWWDHWIDWVSDRSGGTRAAARTLGSRSYPVVEPAPGSYVRQGC
jgi:polyhydroxyalkanoate synthase